MTGLFLSAWVLFPLLLLAISAGCGLLVNRLSGNWMPAVLVLPVGFAATVVICAFTTYFKPLVPPAAALLVLITVLGFALEIKARSVRLTGARAIRLSRPTAVPWAALSALFAGGAIAAPVALTGTPTWTGYTRIVDIAFEMDLAKQLASVGHVVPPTDSSYHGAVNKLLAIGYPDGGQAVLGMVARVAHTDVPWSYQPYLAFAAAMGALAAFALLSRVTSNPKLRAIGAAIAIQANLLYAYALVGGIKELTTVSLLLLVAAVLSHRLPGDGQHAGTLPLAVAIAAALAAFSFGAVPWIGLLLAPAFVVSMLRPARLRTIAAWALTAILTAVLALPTVVDATKLFGIASQAIGGVVDLGLGNLAYALPAWSASGVWLTGDYRYPIIQVGLTHGFDLLILALAVLGVVQAIRRRDWPLAALGVSAPIVLLYWIAHTGAWLQFKVFTVTAALALTLSFAGVAALLDSRRAIVRAGAWVTALVVAGGVLYGNALAYHDTTLAPASRYRDLAAIGQRYAGQGRMLFPAFDEYAGYFLRDESGAELANLQPGEVALAKGVSAQAPVFALDLNQIALSSIQSYRFIVLPVSPTASRPPSNWDLVQQTRYFQVWRQDRPASTVVAHLPLSGAPHERTAAFCTSLANAIRRAGPKARVAFVRSPLVTAVTPLQGAHSEGWFPLGPGLYADKPGTDDLTFQVPNAGNYEIWLAGSIGRPLDVFVDGRPLGKIAYQERYPDQWISIGTRTLTAGIHVLGFLRGGGSLHPGNGNGPDPDTGDLQLVGVSQGDPASDPLSVVLGSSARRVCDASGGYEWMEIVLPGAVPARLLAASS